MMRMAGNRLVMESDARRVVGELDRLLLLQTERYDGLLREAKASFTALPRRAPVMAGTAYPAEAPAARGMIEEILGAMPEWGTGSCEPVSVLVAPHIDLEPAPRRMGRHTLISRGYPGTHRGPRNRSLPDDGLFSLTDKPYDTPWGVPRRRSFARAFRAVQDPPDGHPMTSRIDPSIPSSFRHSS